MSGACTSLIHTVIVVNLIIHSYYLSRKHGRKVAPQSNFRDEDDRQDWQLHWRHPPLNSHHPKRLKLSDINYGTLKAQHSVRTICVIIDEIETLPVVNSPQVSLSDCQTHCVGETLSKRAGSDFNAWRSVESI